MANMIPQGNASNMALLVKTGQKIAAIPLASILELLPACAVTPAYELPTRITGVFNYHGTVVPVIDLACILHEVSPRLNPHQRFVLCQISHGVIAILVDEVGDLTAIDEACTIGFGNGHGSALRFTIVENDVVPVLQPALLLTDVDESLTSGLHLPELLQIQEQLF